MNAPALVPEDLVGCRFRPVAASLFPEAPPRDHQEDRAERLNRLRHFFKRLLPKRGSGQFKQLRIARAGDEFATLEALADEMDVVEDAVFVLDEIPVNEQNLDLTVPAPRRVELHLDALVRTRAGSYIPVVVTTHDPYALGSAPKRRRPNAYHWELPVARFGVSTPVRRTGRMRMVGSDSFLLPMATWYLGQLGLADGRAGLVGPGSEAAAITEVTSTSWVQAAHLKLAKAPRRVRECETCRFEDHCLSILTEADDISLFAKGVKGDALRAQGFDTVDQLIEHGSGLDQALAKAWREGKPAVVREKVVAPRRADVEIDIDMEAFHNECAYLWGTFDGEDYLPFVAWESADEADNFASFWQWLQERIAEARESGQSVAVYCYAEMGENRWLRSTAERFAGRPGIPSREEIEDFIASDYWVDVQDAVMKTVLGPSGWGLKVMSKAAGYEYLEDDLDGLASMHLYANARAGNDEDANRLLAYNEDDCRATRAVREWLSADCPGAPRA